MGMVGMAIAVITTILSPAVTSYGWIFSALAIGAVIGHADPRISGAGCGNLRATTIRTIGGSQHQGKIEGGRSGKSGLPEEVVENFLGEILGNHKEGTSRGFLRVE